jgi:uncharacterized membrane protein YgdD (TMEM256/DUF423 family)
VELNAFAARWLAIGAVLMLLGVVLGAFGAHVAAGRLAPRDLEILQTAVSYHQLHALGVMIVACAARTVDPGLLRVAARLLFAGVVLFSGSLYALALGAPRALGAVTPIGGLSFMAGWIAVAWHAWRVARRAGPTVTPRT